MEFLFKTKGNANPQGKRRVLFTCHPDDFSGHFDKICQDIFKSHDCAIFYTQDMTQALSAQEKETDFESNNLLVVPVTFRLLTEPNRAMDEDIPYAAEKHIPVLPFMMESDLDELYQQKFGERQYLKPQTGDDTEIAYEEKLKKYLESVLVSDELAQKIRAAFDAYIFLSYRKKDRRYANELMQLIHAHPECRDVAIWYDEFLTPGESFRENIEKMLADSKLFALLVTPNLLEEPDGKPNFVMGEEYPAAHRAGKPILPAEMAKTDWEALSAKFADIPTCVDPHDADFKDRLLDAVTKAAIKENDRDPMHNFLIGLAYLEGIDVEVNRQRGLEMITSAAEADLPEAMARLYYMYTEGVGVKLDYGQGVKWAERLAEHFKKECGDEDPVTLRWLNILAMSYSNVGDYQKALKVQEEVYALSCKVLGEEDATTLFSMSTLALAYSNVGDYLKAQEVLEKEYTLRSKSVEENDQAMITCLGNLAFSHGQCGNFTKAVELNEKVYALNCQVRGEEHPETIVSLGNLAYSYSQSGEFATAVELNEKAYALNCQVRGEEHPFTLLTLGNLAMAYGQNGDLEKSLELSQQVYEMRCRLVGEKHPHTLLALGNLANAYSTLEEHEKALECFEKVCELNRETLGQEHPVTLLCMNNLAHTYGELGDLEKARDMLEELYPINCRVLGEEHPNALLVLTNLASTYREMENYEMALSLQEKVYTQSCAILGEEHPQALMALGNLGYDYGQMGDLQKALELQEQMCTLCLVFLGEEHPTTAMAQLYLANTYMEMGGDNSMEEWLDELFDL